MRELTLVIDDMINNELSGYLSSLEGINNVKINNEICEIYVNYDENLISLNVLKMEILSFLKLMKIPSIISFKKHSKKNLVDYMIVINDLCCDYCLKGMIDELLLVDGIDYVDSNFDYKNKKNVQIYVKYDTDIISEEDVIKLMNKFNDVNNVDF